MRCTIYDKLFMLPSYMHWMKIGGSYMLKKICHNVSLIRH